MRFLSVGQIKQVLRPRGLEHPNRKIGAGARMEIELANLATHALGVAGKVLSGKAAAQVERWALSLEQRMVLLQETPVALERYRTLFKASPIGFHNLTPEGIIVEVNDRWCELLGYEKHEVIDEVIGHSIFEFIVDEQAENAKIRFKERLQGVPEDRLTPRDPEDPIRRYKIKGGGFIYVETQDTVFRNSAGRVRGVQTSFQDITAQIKAEQELIVKERYAAIGEIAARMSHALKGLLAGAVGNVDLLRGQYHKIEALMQILRSLEKIGRPIDGDKEDSLFSLLREMGDLICAIDKSVAAMGETTRHLLGFSRSGYERKTIIGVREAASSVVSEIEAYAAQKDVKVAIEFKNIVSTDGIFINKLGFEDMLRNLIKNAIEAYPNVGVGGEDRSVKVTVLKNDQGRIVTLVADKGEGISEERQTQLRRVTDGSGTIKSFKPGGTAIGFLCVRKVVDSAEGSLDIISRLGEGTTMVVSFLAKHFEPTGGLRKAPALVDGIRYDVSGIKVMLVDDDVTTRMPYGQILEAMGFHVISFEDPNEALREYRVMPSKPQIVVTDIDMPQMQGTELVEKIAGLDDEANPHFVVYTGHRYLIEDRDFDLFRQKFEAALFIKSDLAGVFRQTLAEVAAKILGRDPVIPVDEISAEKSPYVRFLSGVAERIDRALNDLDSWLDLAYQNETFNLVFQDDLEESRDRLTDLIGKLEGFVSDAVSKPLSLEDTKEAWQAIDPEQRYKLAVMVDIYMRNGLPEVKRLIEGDLSDIFPNVRQRLAKLTVRFNRLKKAAQLSDDALPVLAQKFRSYYELLANEA